MLRKVMTTYFTTETHIKVNEQHFVEAPHFTVTVKIFNNELNSYSIMSVKQPLDCS